VYRYIDEQRPNGWGTGSRTVEPADSGDATTPLEGVQAARLSGHHAHGPLSVSRSLVGPAFSLTLGRECPNPRPVYYAYVHNWLAPYTDGSISYSDGIHDDVNKVVWSARGWTRR